jgi:hypothetical protein
MGKQVITQGLNNYLETEDGTLKELTIGEAKAILGFDNVEEVPLEGQVIGQGKFFESDGGNISKIIPADN